jgi:hypothetical protein
MSAPLENLEVYFEEDAGGQVKLDTNSTRYRIVKAIIHLALCVLETPEGRRSLADIARDIIRARDNTPGSKSRRPHHIYTDSPARIPLWIDRFLSSLRADFPGVVIAEQGLQGEAEVERYDWGSDMRDYDSRGAGVLYVKKSIIINMANVLPQHRDDDTISYDLFKFQMVVSVAHEMLHFLTGYLTGSATPDTPPQVNAVPYRLETSRGEAGRNWESNFLGGFVEMWSVDSDPLGPRQPGMPYLFPSGPTSTTAGREVSLAYISEFLKQGKSRSVVTLNLGPGTWTNVSPGCQTLLSPSAPPAKLSLVHAHNWNARAVTR